MPEIQEEWAELQQKGQTDGIDLEQFLTVDEDLETSGEPTIQDFIRGHISTPTPSDDEDDAEIVEKPPITISEAAKALDVLQSFMEQNADYEYVKLVDKLEEKVNTIRSERSIQPKITDFFH
jgi:hypothetical protein